ncbi:MAG TPA: FIST N-terminal domain-containing protein [Candidatus Binatia bacterium]|jgi:small ligand-binding sensory domain FIST
MRFASTTSLAPTLAAAVREGVASIDVALGGARPDLLVAFVSPQHAGAWADLPDMLAPAGARVAVGCSAGGVIGGGHEVEGRAGLALGAAVLPDVALAPFHVETDHLPPLEDGAGWRALVGDPAFGDDPTHVLALADPFTCDVEALLAGWDRHHSGGRTFGGLASGGSAPGQNVLVANGTLHRGGAVAVALRGNLEVETIVAQGCRPVGDPMFVTAAEGPLIRGLDGEPAAQVLRGLYEGLEPRDQELFRHSLFLGLVMRPARDRYTQGDFLIRNIVGLDRESGGIVIGAAVQAGSVVQFHLRDATTSAEDVEAHLARAGAGSLPVGGFLFSCLGRGVHLYGAPDHDSDAFRRRFGDVPLVGFFCNGEIGPVQGATFVHGYTSAFALLSPRAS